MTLAEIYASGRFGLSFELFPPKTAKGDEALMRHVEQLMRFRPSYITCTYGAGGSTRAKTLEVVRRVKERFGVPVAAHLTCVGTTVDQLRDYLRRAASLGVDYIVALRGDPPGGERRFAPPPGGLSHADQLVALIRAEFPRFGVAVGGYPEKHQESPSLEEDLRHLKRKVEAGADVVLTQLFYNNDDFFRFRDLYEQLEIPAPLVPGLLPITNLAQVQRITSLCGAKLPPALVQRLAERDDPEWQLQVGVEHAARQARQLIERGAPGLHLYVLNKSQAATALLEAVRP